MTLAAPLLFSVGQTYRASVVIVDTLFTVCAVAFLVLMILIIYGSLATHSRKLSWRSDHRIASARTELAKYFAAGGVEVEPSAPVALMWAKFRRWLSYQKAVGVLTFVTTEALFVAAALSSTGSAQTGALVPASFLAGAILTGALLTPGVLLTQFRNPQLDCLHLVRQVLRAAKAHIAAPEEQTTKKLLSAATRLGSVLPKIAMRSYLIFPNEHLQNASVVRFSRHSDALTEAVLIFDSHAMDETNTKTFTRLALAVLDELAWTQRDAVAVHVEDFRLVRQLRDRERRLDRIVNVAPVLVAMGFLLIVLVTQQLAHHHGYNLSHPGSILPTTFKWVAAIFTAGKLLTLMWNRVTGRSRPAELEATAHDLATEASDLAERTAQRQESHRN